MFAWIVVIVMAYAASGHLDTLQRWIWKAQAKVVYESRTSTWGSPRFFADDESHRIPNRRESPQINKRK